MYEEYFKDEDVDLLVCPNGCHAPLIASVNIPAELKINCEGELGEEVSSRPEIAEILWVECSECHQNAEEIFCRKLFVYDNNQSSVPCGTLYLPHDSEEDPCGYFVEANGTIPEKITFVEDDGRKTFYVHGARYAIDEDKVVPILECSGQLDLEGNEIP